MVEIRTYKIIASGGARASLNAWQQAFGSKATSKVPDFSVPTAPAVIAKSKLGDFQQFGRGARYLKLQGFLEFLCGKEAIKDYWEKCPELSRKRNRCTRRMTMPPSARTWEFLEGLWRHLRLGSMGLLRLGV